MTLPLAIEHINRNRDGYIVFHRIYHFDSLLFIHFVMAGLIEIINTRTALTTPLRRDGKSVHYHIFDLFRVRAKLSVRFALSRRERQFLRLSSDCNLDQGRQEFASIKDFYQQ